MTYGACVILDFKALAIAKKDLSLNVQSDRAQKETADGAEQFARQKVIESSNLPSQSAAL